MKHSFPEGVFVVFEGIDGSGKSTQAKLLQQHLAARGCDVVLTKEPTDGPWGRLLRESATTGRLSLEEELETFIKDRKQHLAELILPSLKSGKVVISDRYYFSTAAYQGARGMDPDEIIRRNEEFAPEPDLLILMDLDPAKGRDRISGRGDTANLFETSQGLVQARAIFNAMNKPYLVRIDGIAPAESIHRQIVSQFEKLAGPT